MARKAMAKKTAKRGRPARAASKRVEAERRVKSLRHLKMPNEDFERIRDLFNSLGAPGVRKGSKGGKPMSGPAVLINRLEEGQTEITSTFSAGQIAQTAVKLGIKVETRKGVFVLGTGVPPMEGVAVTRVS